jgi:hypothetical protein
MPSFWRFFGLSIVQINGNRVVWWCIGVSERKEENTPIRCDVKKVKPKAGI